MRYKKLLIISHTPHQIDLNGNLLGWGPTVGELNYLSNFWEEMVHVGCLEAFENNPSYLPYSNNNIKVDLIPSFGGKTFISKLSVFYNAPSIVFKILKNIPGSTHIQVRVPMGIGIYVLPLFCLIPRKFTLWVKYANNWGYVSSSLGYRLQRWFLQQNFLRCKVTINGFWPRQSKHCISFENPCISSDQLVRGGRISKNFDGKLKIVFAGRMDDAKGIDLLLEVLETLPKDKIDEWIFIGDGPLKSDLEDLVESAQVNARFFGFVSQDKVKEVLMGAHVLVLPSKSEGFPKIVAEAWNYGVIPVVSPVGSLPHYLENGINGFLMESINSESLYNSLIELISSNSLDLEAISKQGNKLASKFTFENYLSHLKQEVFV